MEEQNNNGEEQLAKRLKEEAEESVRRIRAEMSRLANKLFNGTGGDQSPENGCQ